MSDETALKKAQLIMSSGVSLEPGADCELITHRDGRPVSLVTEFEGTHVRLKVVEDGEFTLRSRGDGYEILRNGKTFIEDAKLVRMFCHSPHMAVISLGAGDNPMSVDDALSTLAEYMSTGDVKAVSLHGGKTCSDEHYAEVVSAFRKECPDLPIGVSPEDFSLKTLIAFKDAGADEIKMTVKTFVPRIAAALGVDLDDARRKLRDAVSVFGRNKVVCTVYMGIGESDEEHRTAISELCQMGVMPDTKIARGSTRGNFEKTLGPLEKMTPERYAERIITLKETMKTNDLDPNMFNTMCYGCRLCTIVPFKDF